MNEQKTALSGAELVARAGALIPALRERSAAAEESGRIPEETVEDLIAADLFRAVVPARFGGHELDSPIFQSRGKRMPGEKKAIPWRPAR